MIKAIVFDLDGTIYFGENVTDGALDAITILSKNYRIFFLTNNSGKRRLEIISKLNKMGFMATAQNTYCGSYAISSYLAENKITPVYLIGTGGLASDIASHGIRIENSSDVSAVVVGIDQLFSYEKIGIALEAINRGAKLIVANTDSSYSIENNRKMPGCGAMVGAIVGATGRVPDFHAGKPNTYMLELICKEHGFSAADICIIGDSVESDIAMAAKFNCQSILFDPNGDSLEFRGKRAEKFYEIIPLIKKRRIGK